MIFFQNIPLTELTADAVHQHLNISGSEPKSSSAFCFYLPHGWVTWWSVHFHFLSFSCRRRRHDTVTQRRLFVLDDSSPSPPPDGGCGADGSQNPQNPQNNRPNHRPVSAKEKKKWKLLNELITSETKETTSCFWTPELQWPLMCITRPTHTEVSVNWWTVCLCVWLDTLITKLRIKKNSRWKNT